MKRRQFPVNGSICRIFGITAMIDITGNFCSGNTNSTLTGKEFFKICSPGPLLALKLIMILIVLYKVCQLDTFKLNSCRLTVVNFTQAP